MKGALLALLAFCGLIALANGDCYMHNPRGSNDRNNEANTNRNNGNLAFDSQNNAKGGYCWGPAMSFYEGSLLSVEWTNQHGCGEASKLYCNLVLQYMCGKKDDPASILIRDGVGTTTPPNDENTVNEQNANGEYIYLQHEPIAYYQACQTRDRNMGLWISDREEEGGLTPGRRSAVFTRQNNNGNRHGFECAEERDYYPYWHPTPWRDVAILTHDESWCAYYKAESQNVKARNYCTNQEGNPVRWNNEIQCGANGGVWQTQESWGIPAPDCVKAPHSRNNHLGNGNEYELAAFSSMYNWTLPTSAEEDCINGDNCNCILRIRYNISTLDLGPEANRPDAGFIDWTMNAGNSPVLEDEIVYQDGLPHELALDTSQYGRTFQDRSFVFHIRPRPSGMPLTQRIFNLNVRGKRGNIVQAYPAVEYDFAPSYLFARAGDYIHFQWTGCDTNPAGNAGEGTDQTDRHNMVQIETMAKDIPAKDEWLAGNAVLFDTPELRQHMAYLGQTNCLSYEELKTKHNNNQNQMEQDVQNCMKLNAAPQYFDAGLVRMNTTGDFYYMSSRNNNFTNREQKGTIAVVPLLPVWAIVVVVIGAAFFVGSAGVAGAMLYAKSHPHSGVANMMSRV